MILDASQDIQDIPSLTGRVRRSTPHAAAERAIRTPGELPLLAERSAGDRAIQIMPHFTFPGLQHGTRSTTNRLFKCHPLVIWLASTRGLILNVGYTKHQPT
jgi:hypothetical protein